MTPNFALGLTEDGITLWLSADAGWLRVGAVAMDAADLDAEMQALVARARALAPEGLATKLVIPDDQILFTQMPGTADEGAIRAGLQGQTPYPVEELDFAVEKAGNVVRLAVVARETLLEAQDFAQTQGLNPVCFVAAPKEQGFAAEPFFGRVHGVTLTEAELGRGGPILREVGMATLPKPEPAPETNPETKPESKPDPAPQAALPDAAKPETPKTETAPADAAKQPDAAAITKPAEPAGASEAPASISRASEAPSSKASGPASPDAGKPVAQASQRKPDPAIAARDDHADPAQSGFQFGKPEAKTVENAPAASGFSPRPNPAPAAPQPDGAMSFRSRRVAPTPSSSAPGLSAQASAKMPKGATAQRPAPGAKAGKALSALARTRSLLLGGTALAERLRASVAAPVSRAGNGLRNATGLLTRIAPRKSDIPALPAGASNTKPQAQPKPVPKSGAKGPAIPAPAAQSQKPASTAPDTIAAKRGDAGSGPRLAVPKLPMSGTPKPQADPEAERLTVFGARRAETEPASALPRRALAISGAALALVLAVVVWVFYFSRATEPDLAQPVLPQDPVAEIAAPDALALPDTAPDSTDQIEQALGQTDAVQQADRPQATDTPADTPVTAQDAPGAIASDAASAELAAPDAGRMAGLRSVRAIAPAAPGDLPDIQAAPAPFGTEPLPPLRDAPQFAAPVTPPAAEPDLPAGEEALEIVVTQGAPSVVPPARPAGLAPDLPAQPEPDLAPVPTPETVPTPEGAPAPDLGLAPQADPLDESALVIDVTQGTPSVVPPNRPETIAPVTAPAPDEAAPDASAVPEDQANLAPPPGGVALSLIAPAPLPAAIIEQAVARTSEPTAQFADATPQAVAASLRPGFRPDGFSQTVERALAAARIQAVATPQGEIVRASAATAAPSIPSSASVTRAATEARAINLRQINLLGVMGTPSARRALVRLDNGRVVTVSVGERLDGGQVTAIGDNELRYNKRGRDVVLRIAS